MSENNTQGVEFTEEKDAIQDRMDTFGEAEYTGLLGWVIKKTGYSKQKVSMILVLVAISIFVLSIFIFMAAYTDKKAVTDFRERAENSRL